MRQAVRQRLRPIAAIVIPKTRQEETDDDSRRYQPRRPRQPVCEPAVVADRRADGSIVLKSTVPLGESARCVGDWLEHWAGKRRTGSFSASVPASMRPGPPSPTGKLSAGSRGRRLDPGARLERRTPAGHPLRQRHRSRAVRAGRPACRRALGGDLAGLFADVQGFRQAQDHGHAAASPARSMFPAQNRSPRRWLRSSLCIRPKSSAATADDDAIPSARMPATAETAGCRKSLRGGDPGHHRKIPVHLGLDRHAESGDQHPAHADLEPASQGADLDVPREERDLVILDWLPWSHTFGANHNFNLVLRNGGTLYIDGGKPAPAVRDLAAQPARA